MALSAVRLVVVELLDQTQVVQGLTYLNEEASILLAASIPHNDAITQAILCSATSSKPTLNETHKTRVQGRLGELSKSL